MIPRIVLYDSLAEPWTMALGLFSVGSSHDRGRLGHGVIDRQLENAPVVPSTSC